jgi:hypothetical protein
VTKQISSDAVSGSIAIANWSTLLGARDTPPRSSEAVPVATWIVVVEAEIVPLSVVATLILEYFLAIYFP